jgi:hypothetical protein
MNANNMSRAASIVSEMAGSQPKVKLIRKERGLLEREEMENEKIILAEDNRQLIFG